MNDDDLRRLFEETLGFDETAEETQRHAELDRRVRALEHSVADLQARVDRLETTTH